jgi:hypothetical protein
MIIERNNFKACHPGTKKIEEKKGMLLRTHTCGPPEKCY